VEREEKAKVLTDTPGRRSTGKMAPEKLQAA